MSNVMQWQKHYCTSHLLKSHCVQAGKSCIIFTVSVSWLRLQYFFLLPHPVEGFIDLHQWGHELHFYILFYNVF